jgi:hypothetical protein
MVIKEHLPFLKAKVRLLQIRYTVHNRFKIKQHEVVTTTILHYVCIQLALHNSGCGLYKDSQCMWMEWLLKSEKVALMKSNETRNSCIYIRFCSLAVFMLWAHIIGSVGYWGCASSLLQSMWVATTTTATAGMEVESYKMRPQLVTLEE